MDTTTDLSRYFGHSDPGDANHHLVLAYALPNALGLPGDDLSRHVCVIAPVWDAGSGMEPPGQFVPRAVIDAITSVPSGALIQMVTFTVETHIVPPTDDEAKENRQRRMLADHQLHEHPDAAEATLLYAASRDGRRWCGTHWLTGPKAGTILGPIEVAGPPTNDDRKAPCGQTIRRAVGIHW